MKFWQYWNQFVSLLAIWVLIAIALGLIVWSIWDHWRR